MAGPQFKPYMQGAGPLPNDEYGDGHRQVDPRLSKQTNMNIAGQFSGDGNLSGMQNLYGQPGVEGAPYTDGPGLGPQDLQQFSGQKSRMQDITQGYIDMFGEEVAVQILDDVLRLAASQDVNGPMDPPSMGGMPPPDFGGEQRRQDDQAFYDYQGTSHDPAHPDYHEQMRQDEETYYMNQTGRTRAPEVPGSIAPPQRGMMGRKIRN